MAVAREGAAFQANDALERGEGAHGVGELGVPRGSARERSRGRSTRGFIPGPWHVSALWAQERRSRVSPEVFIVSFQLAAALGQLPKAANDNARSLHGRILPRQGLVELDHHVLANDRDDNRTPHLGG